jgi:aryl-alcohol dehydrogenase-like predicted oxidoreductase
MQTSSLVMTNLEVSRIAFGTWQLGGEWGRFDDIMAGALVVGGPSPETVR